MQVLQAVPLEVELVVAHQGIALDEVVRGRKGIVDEAGQGQLLASRVAADARRALEHQHAEARASSVGGGNEVVVPGPGEDDVVLAHAVAPRYRRPISGLFRTSGPGPSSRTRPLSITTP